MDEVRVSALPGTGQGFRRDVRAGDAIQLPPGTEKRKVVAGAAPDIQDALVLDLSEQVAEHPAHVPVYGTHVLHVPVRLIPDVVVAVGRSGGGLHRRRGATIPLPRNVRPGSSGPGS